MLGSDNGYRRLFKKVMENYNEDFGTTGRLGIDYDNIKAHLLHIHRKK